MNDLYFYAAKVFVDPQKDAVAKSLIANLLVAVDEGEVTYKMKEGEPFFSIVQGTPEPIGCETNCNRDCTPDCPGAFF
mgnify:CR=1 FL=1